MFTLLYNNISKCTNAIVELIIINATHALSISTVFLFCGIDQTIVNIINHAKLRHGRYLPRVGKHRNLVFIWTSVAIDVE